MTYIHERLNNVIQHKRVKSVSQAA